MQERVLLLGINLLAQKANRYGLGGGGSEGDLVVKEPRSGYRGSLACS